MQKALITLACLFAISFGIQAQENDIQQDKKSLIGAALERGTERARKYAHNRWQDPDDKDTTIIARLLKMNTPMLPEFNTNHLFNFVSKNENYAFGVGAFVRASFLYSFGDNDDSESNDPRKLGQMGQLNKSAGNAHISGSNISFNFVGMPKKGHYIAAFVGLKVSQNDDYHPRLDHAYVRYNYFTVGKTSTTYDDNIANFFIIDPTDAVASGGGGNMQISYQPVYKNWRFGVAVEQIRSSFTYADNDFGFLSVSQICPDFPFYASYEPSSKWHVRMAGVLRGLRYADQRYSDKPHIHTAFGWGLKLTGHYKSYPFNSFYQIQTGQGNASFFSGCRDMNLDLVPDTERPGYLTQPTHLGATIGLQYNWGKNLYSVFRTSYVKNWINRYDGGLIAWADHNNSLMNSNLNIMWNVNRLMSCGIEYCYCARQTNDRRWFDSHQIMAMAYVSF